MSTTTMLARRPETESADLLGRVRDQALAAAREDGHRVLLFPDLCLYRFSAPTTYAKAATFGVTLGAVLQGAKRVRFGGDELTIDPSRLLVVTRESAHQSSVIAASRQAPYVGLSLCFSPERVARALLALVDAGGTPSREAVPAFLLDCDADIAGALERLLRTLDDPLDRKLLAPLIIDEILFRLLRSDDAAAVRAGVGPAGDAGRILEAMRFIRERHAEKLNVEQLARAVAMSPSHFAHRFRAVARITPMKYLREVRLDAARARLLGNGARVSEVAVDVGFDSPAHFTREFKRRFGVSPSRARPVAAVHVGVEVGAS
jgi:AraC-like DNA-binding protein